MHTTAFVCIVCGNQIPKIETICFILRRINDVLKEMKEADPECMLTWKALQRLIVTGEITRLKYGNAWLINLDELYLYFTKGGEKK